MSVIRYRFCSKKLEHGVDNYVSLPTPSSYGDWVAYTDYEWLNDYCDHLVQFSKLACLPKDLENLRESNTLLAEENFKLQQENEQLQRRLFELLD
jgi:hypothetical protein